MAGKATKMIRCADCGTEVPEGIHEVYMVQQRSFNVETHRYEWSGKWVCRGIEDCWQRQDVKAQPAH